MLGNRHIYSFDCFTHIVRVTFTFEVIIYEALQEYMQNTFMDWEECISSFKYGTYYNRIKTSAFQTKKKPLSAKNWLQDLIHGI